LRTIFAEIRTVGTIKLIEASSSTCPGKKIQNRWINGETMGKIP
jgi:hypothetical protein